MRIFCSTLAIFAFAIFPVLGETYTDLAIEKITSDSVESSVRTIGTDPAPPFQVMELFDVYEKSETIADEKTYSGYVDSVYLESVKYVKTDGAYKLVFEYVWEGEDKYLKKGFVLVPTGRKFEIDKTDIKVFIQTRYIEDQRASTDESRQLLNLYLNSGCIFILNHLFIDLSYFIEYSSFMMPSEIAFEVKLGYRLI